MSRHTPSTPLSLSPDVLALNPGLSPATLKTARLGAEHKGTGLVLNGRRVRSQTEVRAFDFIQRHWPGAVDILYEAFSCQIGPTRYTWDFTFRDIGHPKQGPLLEERIAVEVKPERWDVHPSGRAALRSIKQASAFYGAHYRFVGLLEQRGGDWLVQVFRDGAIVSEYRAV